MIFLLIFLPPLATSSAVYWASSNIRYALTFGVMHILGIIFVLSLARAARHN